MNFFLKFTVKIGKIRLFKNNGHVFRSFTCNILKYYQNVCNRKISTESFYNISNNIKYLFVFKNILQS